MGRMRDFANEHPIATFVAADFVARCLYGVVAHLLGWDRDKNTVPTPIAEEDAINAKMKEYESVEKVEG